MPERGSVCLFIFIYLHYKNINIQGTRNTSDIVKWKEKIWLQVNEISTRQRLNTRMKQHIYHSTGMRENYVNYNLTSKSNISMSHFIL